MSKKESMGPCPACGGKMILVEYPLTDKYHYDGVSEYACENSLDALNPKCDFRYGAFCGRTLSKGEVEPPHHQGGPHPRVFVL
jgi:hypothetical protein